MRNVLIAGAAVLGVSVSVPAPAKAAMTGNALWATCSTAENSPLYWEMQNACLYYINGVVDGVQGLEKMASIKDLQAGKTVESILCISPTTTAGQIMDVVKKGLQENPADRDVPANTLVILYVSKGFDCKTRDPFTYSMPSRQGQSSPAKAPPAQRP